MIRTMKYCDVVKFVEENGWNTFLELFKREYPGFKLYSCSTSWLDSKDYICKIKGVYGDIIINWMD